MTSLNTIKAEDKKGEVESVVVAGGSGSSTDLSSQVNKENVRKSPGGAGKKKMGVTFAAGTEQPDPLKKQASQKKKSSPANNLKKENLAYLIQKKKECERRAHEIVLRLIETEVEKAFLLDNAIRISKQHLEDAIEERRLSQLCGWVLCDTHLDPKDIPKQTYSIRANKVYDITERKAFCNGKCYAKAIHFKAQLLTSPLWLRDMEDNVRFEILEDDETSGVHGLSVSLTGVNLSDESDEEHDVEVERTEKSN